MKFSQSRVVLWLFFAFLLSALSGCSWIFQSEPSPPIVEEPMQAASTEAQPPYTLEIEKAVNDGDRLKVVAHVTPLVDRSVEDAVVRLTGTHDGKIIQEETLPLHQALLKQETILEADSTYRLAASIPVKEVSDYQIELIWGRDAQMYREKMKIAQAVKVEKLELQKGEPTCINKQCGTPYALIARVSNVSSAPIHHITLGVGLHFTPEQSKLASPQKNTENEQKIELQGLTLAPGQSRKLKLVFEKLIPELKQGNIEPFVRVMEVS